PARLPSGAKPPRRAEQIFSVQKLTSLGLRRVTVDPVPSGKIATGWTLTDVDGAPHWTPTLEDAPPPPVPASVTPLQARRALRQAGLLVTVEAQIATMGEEAVEAWEYAVAIDRDNPLLLAAA